MNKMIFAVIFLFVLFDNPIAHSETEPATKKTSNQQIGGLLFDMDEGVEIEQGPGGSVYMKSNREHMKQKFDAIEERFKSIEARLDKLDKSSSNSNVTGAGEDSKVASSKSGSVLIN